MLASLLIFKKMNQKKGPVYSWKVESLEIFYFEVHFVINIGC